jgi:hypothetical protein
MPKKESKGGQRDDRKKAGEHPEYVLIEFNLLTPTYIVMLFLYIVI